MLPSIAADSCGVGEHICGHRDANRVRCPGRGGSCIVGGAESAAHAGVYTPDHGGNRQANGHGDDVAYCVDSICAGFRGLDGGIWIEELLTNLPGGVIGFLLVANLAIFVLGFFI